MSYNRVNGYAAECERTVFPGEPSAEERKLYDIVMEARALAFEMVKPGTRCSDIDMTTQEFFKKDEEPTRGSSIVIITTSGIHTEASLCLYPNIYIVISQYFIYNFFGFAYLLSKSLTPLYR